MFCSNCGNQLSESALFCQECGAKVNSEENAVDNLSVDKTDLDNSYVTEQDKFNREKQFEHHKGVAQDMLGKLKKMPYQEILDKLKKAPLLLKAGIVIGIILAIALYSMMYKSGRAVRDAYLDYYSSSVTVGDAFDSFFENGKWSEHKENGDTYVVYTGDCWYLDERVNVKIRFRIGDDCFYFANMEMNGQPQSDIISEALFDKVYEAYY